MRIRSPIFLILIPALFFLYAGIGIGDAFPGVPECPGFRIPSQKEIVTTPVCTLGVDTSCKRVSKVEIRARYIPANSDNDIEVTINEKYYPKLPYLFPWDLKEIPNQLFFGLGTIIDVSFTDGTISSLTREGIFLAHQPITYPVQKQLQYEAPGAKTFPKDTLRIPSSTVSAFAQMYWNEKGLTTRVSVTDPSFHADAPADLLGKMGVELLIDPTHKQKPYPTEETMIFVVPLAGKPYRITYRPLFFPDSGIFELNPTFTASKFDTLVEKHDRQGFAVTFTIPRHLFEKTMPGEMGLNIIVKTANDSGGIVTSSWINARNLDNYSPLLWSSILVNPKPVLKASWIIWVGFFLAGLIVPLLFNLVLTRMIKNRPRVLFIKHTKEENQTFEKAKEAIDRLITSKTMSIQDIANEIQVTPGNLENIIKKVAGISYKNYIAYLRTEIVCERLRSSHSREDAIAESCGFNNVKEMARTFRKYHNLTPANYRKIQQVTK